MPPIRKNLSITLHPRAVCEDCPWTRGPGTGTREAAKGHARTKQHAVVIISETRDSWGPTGG